jgi:predicted transposase/invertase (TIGR01784 family)
MEKISPRVDLAFKKIFGVEENKDLLISLINSIVGTEDQVVDITLLNPYNPKNFQNDKLSILDIKAKGHNSKMFNIEIQVADEADYDKRALYYWAKVYSGQLMVSEDYTTLNKAICIHILNFTSILDSDKYHNVFNIREKDSNKDLELHTIELKKFCPSTKEALSEFVLRIKSALDIWLAFLTRNDLLNKNDLPKALDNPSLKKALEVIDEINFNSEERMAYEDRLGWLRMEASAFKKYEDNGFEKGLEEGRLEQAYAIAKAMKSDGMPNEVIIKFTGLSMTEIEKL